MERGNFAIFMVVFVSTLGLSLPYPVLAPLFLASDPLLDSLWNFSPLLSLAITLAAYPFGQFLSSPLLGRLSDRLGPKKVLSSCLGLAILGYTLSYIAVEQCSVIMLVTSRFLTGSTEGIIGIARGILGRCSEKEEHAKKAANFAYLNAATVSGWLLGPIVGGVLADENIFSMFKPAMAFAGAALLTLIALGFTLAYLPRPTSQQHLATESSTPLVVLFKDRRLLLLVCCSSSLTLACDTFYQFFPVISVTKWNFGPGNIAVLTGLLTTAMICAHAFIVPRINLANVTAKLQFFGAIFTTALATLTLVDIVPYYLHFPVVGICIGVLATLFPVLVSNATPSQDQGFVMSAMMGLRYLLDSFICICGALIGEINLSMPFILASAFVALAILTHTLLVSDSK